MPDVLPDGAQPTASKRNEREFPVTRPVGFVTTRDRMREKT